MLSTTSILLIVMGFCFAIVGAFSRSYMWGRLRDTGAAVPRWFIISDDLRAGGQYLGLAKQGRVPFWPPIIAAVGLIGGFLLMVAAIFRPL